MKRLVMLCAVLGAVVTSGCGQYAFFRDPGEQLSINRAYDRDVAARQGTAPPVGATSGSGTGEVPQPR